MLGGCKNVDGNSIGSEAGVWSGCGFFGGSECLVLGKKSPVCLLEIIPSKPSRSDLAGRAGECGFTWFENFGIWTIDFVSSLDLLNAVLSSEPFNFVSAGLFGESLGEGVAEVMSNLLGYRTVLLTTILFVIGSRISRAYCPFSRGWGFVDGTGVGDRYSLGETEKNSSWVL